jgi:hypothetical protein
MPTILSESEIQDTDILDGEPLYRSCLAIIRPGDDGPIEATCPINSLTPTDMALPLSVICVEGANGSHSGGQ